MKWINLDTRIRSQIPAYPTYPFRIVWKIFFTILTFTITDHIHFLPELWTTIERFYVSFFEFDIVQAQYFNLIIMRVQSTSASRLILFCGILSHQPEMWQISKCLHALHSCFQNSTFHNNNSVEGSSHFSFGKIIIIVSHILAFNLSFI